MNTTIPDLLAAAMALPERDRELFAMELLNSVRPPGIMSEDDPGFFEELERRSQACDSGEAQTIPWEEVERRLRQKLNDRRKS